MEEYLGSTVSVECWSDSEEDEEFPVYQGILAEVNEENQSIMLQRCMKNGEPYNSESVCIMKNNIMEIYFLNEVVYHTEPLAVRQETKLEPRIAPVAGIERYVHSKINGTSGASSDETSTVADNEVECGSIDNEDGIISPAEEASAEEDISPISCSDSYDPMHSYRTDDGIRIGCVSTERRDRLFHEAKELGFNTDRQIEGMGRCCLEFIIHNLGGIQRFHPNKNKHPQPCVLVTVDDEDSRRAAYALCCARLLSNRKISVSLVYPKSFSCSSCPELKITNTISSIKTYSSIEEIPTDGPPFDVVLCASTQPIPSRFNCIIINVDPPCTRNVIKARFSLLPGIPLHYTSSNVGRLYLCDIGIPLSLYESLQNRFSSPFGARCTVALYD